jgi:ComF family protein
MPWTGRWLVDALFPPVCPACSRASRDNGFCEPCTATIPLPRGPLCPACGSVFRGAGSDHLCARCLGRPPHFDRVRACASYSGSSPLPNALGLALHRYKYGGDVTLAPVLGRMLADRCPLAIDHDLIVPVPLHLGRLRARGFNQSLLLARPLSRDHRVPIARFTLARRRETRPQVGLGENDRRRNIAGAFEVRERAQVRGRSVLLVDDVYTTGATVNECARTLRQAGARRIDVLVLARAETATV